MMKLNRYLTFFLVFFISVGCSKYDADVKEMDYTGQVSSVALFNAIPGSTNLQVILGETSQNSGNVPLRYRGYQHYRSVYPGERSLNIESTRTGGKNTYVSKQDFEGGKVYSLFVCLNKAQQVEVIKTTDNVIVQNDAKIAKIRVANMSPDVLALSLNSSALLGDEDQKSNLSTIGFAEVTPFVHIKAGEKIKLDIGSLLSSNSEPYFSEEVQLQGMGLYTILITGSRQTTDGEDKLMYTLIHQVK